MQVYDLCWDLSQVVHRRRLSYLRFNWLRVQRVHAKVSYMRKRELTHTYTIYIERKREEKREKVCKNDKSGTITAKYVCNWREGPVPL